MLDTLLAICERVQIWASDAYRGRAQRERFQDICSPLNTTIHIDFDLR